MGTHRLKVLLVEDNPDHVRLIRRHLHDGSERTISVRQVDNLSAAIQHLAEGGGAIDAVLLDPTLPDSDAATTLPRLLAVAPTVPVVVLTATDDLDVATRAVQQGAQDYVLKSDLAGELLIRSLHYAVERKRAECRLKELTRTLEDRVAQRTASVKLLQDVAVIANASDTVEQAFRATLERICEYMDWPVCHGSTFEEATSYPVDVWYLEDPEWYRPFYEATRRSAATPSSSLRGRVFSQGTPAWVVDVTASDFGSQRAEAAKTCGLHAAFAFPIFAGTDVAGLMEFFAAAPLDPDDEFLEVMAHVGTQLGRVVERHQLQQQLIDAVWEQQRQFGQELHDSLGQELAGMGLLVGSLERRLRGAARPEADDMTELAKMVRHAQSSTRRLCKGLMPVEVDAEGLRAALEELCAKLVRQSHVDCRLDCDPSTRVHNNRTATHLFRIAQEAAGNALQHGNPERIEISLTSGDSRIVLSVRDDGDGLPADGDFSTGLGMRTMKYRANVIGAELSVQTGQGSGTVVTCTLNPEGTLRKGELNERSDAGERHPHLRRG